jgi:cation:H+ antiporter
MGFAPLLIGLTIVAFATSAPEILVSVVAATRGEPGLAFGNAIGSNIANIGLVLGVTALVRPIPLESATLRREMPALLAVSLLTVSLFLDSRLSRPDGIVMLTGLAIVMIWFVRLGIRSADTDPIKMDYEAEIPKDVSTKMAFIWLVVGLGVLLLGAGWLVDGSIGIAQSLGVSEVVIGITIVAVGTSLPELAVTATCAFKGEAELALGNIIGSNIFNLLAVVGLAVIIHPVALDAEVLYLHFPVMIVFTVALFFMAYNKQGESRIRRQEGFVLLLAFVAYYGLLVARAF